MTYSPTDENGGRGISGPTGSSDQPRVTPSLLRDAQTTCPRRLALDFYGEKGSSDPLGRARLRDPFISAVRSAHGQGGPIESKSFRAPDGLEPEEQLVFAHASRWYEVLYSDRIVTNYFHDCEMPTLRKGVRVGGWVDLTFVNQDGLKEYRTFDLWRSRSPRDEPLELPAVWLALLRLRPWICGESDQSDGKIRVSWADLITGRRCEQIVNMKTETPELVSKFETSLSEVEARADVNWVEPGIGCSQCRHLGHCPAHSGAITLSATRKDIKPGILRITPTSLETWIRCPRAWRNQVLLSIPASNDGGSPDHGIMVHAVLRFIHDHGSCSDLEHVNEVINAHGGSARLRDEVLRHAERCPVTAESFGHELALARYSPAQPATHAFLATAQLDAVWIHDGILDARDYKTGSRRTLRVADDPRAWVQAWVLGSIAQQKELRLQLRYEHLATEIDEDPEFWELDEEELNATEERLRSEIIKIRETDSWAGVNEPTACRFCRYRSICPDSAAPGEATWLEIQPPASSAQ
ncbi:MAG: PD-(D/E)XK nuclease family protein [Acidimicrobiia bacterium]|nr:PD-(D/E)XK nuclease family protein [Acidimicrobiia bacterium]